MNYMKILLNYIQKYFYLYQNIYCETKKLTYTLSREKNKVIRTSHYYNRGAANES